MSCCRIAVVVGSSLCLTLGLSLALTPPPAAGTPQTDARATQSPSTVPVPAGLWRLDEGTGSVAFDTSGQHDDGSIGAGPTWLDTAEGAALAFDGVSGGVTIPDAPALEPPTQVTVAAWVNHLGSPGQWRYVVAKGATGCISASYAIYSGLHGGLQFYVSRQRGEVYTLSPDAGQSVWDGHWHLVVGTFDGSTLRLYVDGHQVGEGTALTQPLSYSLVNANTLDIGDYPGCVQHTFQGLVRDVAIWDTALSPTAISTLPAYLTLSQASGSSPHGGGSTPGTAPQLRGLTITPATFRAQVARTRWPARVTIRYVDSQPALTTMTVSILATGQVVKGRCILGAVSRPRRDRVCHVWSALGRLRHQDRVGANSIVLRNWRLGGRLLRPGRYLLRAVPWRSGTTGNALSAHFTVAAAVTPVR